VVTETATAERVDSKQNQWLSFAATAELRKFCEVEEAE
jgi:hypothetical protein